MSRAARCGWVVAAALGWALAAGAQQAAEEPAQTAESDEAAETAEAGAAAAAGEKKRDEPEPVSLRELLERLRATVAAERAEDERREAEFRRAKEEQEALTLRTEAQVRSEEAQSARLEETYGENEILLAELDTRLTDRIGQMGELFGVVRLVATDLSGEVYQSLTSLGVEPRVPLLDRLGRNTGLPSTDDMEKLWFELLREMTAQGRVETLQAPVIVERPEGDNGSEPPPVTEERRVTRAGPFTAISEGEYVVWAPKERTVELLSRQPPPRYSETAEGFANEPGAGFQWLAIDPSRGVLLEALTGTPSLIERVNQGGYVGYTIVVLGVFALALGLFRWVGLTATARGVAAQQRRSRSASDNPLGRLLAAFEKHEHDDPEVLELRLDETLLRESSGVQRYLWVVQTISVIAPLLGLLGTVTGMIQTFQAITLFGAGDPKMMASGISEALVTTTLGLVTAIPLVLLHSLLASRARGILGVLEEKRSALIATRLEKQGVPV